MAIGGRLPPLTTHLEGDLDDLAATFKEGTALAEEYALEIDQILTEGMRDTGQNSSNAFRDEAGHGFGQFFDDIDAHMAGISEEMGREGERGGERFSDEFDRSSDRRSRRSGRRFGNGLLAGFSDIGESFQRMMIPLLIGAVILAAPAIGALIGSAVAVGLGLGFAALGTVIAVAMLPKVQKAFAALANPIRAMFKFAITGAFDDALIGVPRIIKTYLPGIGRALRDVFDAVAPLLRPLADNLMQGVDAFINGVAVALQQAGPAVQTWIATIPGMAKAFGDMLVEITKDPEALSRFIGDAATFLEAFLVDSGKLIAWLAEVYDWTVKLNDKSPAPFIQNPAQSVEGWKTIWAGFTSWFSGVWASFTGWLSGKWNALLAWLATIPPKVSAFFAGLPDFFIGLWHKILYGVGWMAGQFVLYFLHIPEMLGKAVAFLWDFLWTSFTGIVKLVAGLAYKAVMAVVNWFKALPGRVAEGFTEFKTKVTSFFKNAPSWLYQAGKDLIHGLVSGIKDTLGWAIDKAKSAAHDIASGFKSALGISSPSKLSRGFGRFFMQGFGLGLFDEAPNVRSQFNSLVSGMGYNAVGAEMGAGMRSASGGAGGGVAYVETTVNIDGQAAVRAITPAAQRTASRSGPTGLGARPSTGFGF